ncbi:FAD binding domain protein [Hypoxylon sp. FL1284]|nr:FAD binding domain protein [Hypoxylon sp. FL1284]
MLPLSLLALASTVVAAHSQHCKNIPGDGDWPRSAEWDALNKTIGGRLIGTVPLACVCHTQGKLAAYNETACSILKTRWDWSQIHFETPAAIMPAWFQASCNPFSPTSQPCELGNYASYSINVTSAEDVIAGINFAKAYNIRLVIKNTGHDLSGKSTGAGSLSLWMHNVKATEIILEYESAYYTGPAIRVGTGVLGLEAYEAAHDEGYRVLGGNCPSVAFAGGYTQGGGHSALSSQYGLAADNVLEWEVVTATGEHLIAAPKSNSVIYWALSGGGGGTFAVVLSMTARLHQDGSIGGGYLTFDNVTAGSDAFWKAVELFNQRVPEITDKGGNTIAYSLSNSTFGIYNLVAPGQSAAEVRALLEPFLSDLKGLGIPYNCSTHESATYLDRLRRDYGPFPDGPFMTSGMVGGRLIPRAVLLSAANNNALTQVLRDAASGSEYAILMQSLNVNTSGTLSVAPVADNAVLPAWRGAAFQTVISVSWDWTVPRTEMERREHVLVSEITPALEAATPNSGVYLNEANFVQDDWQAQFYGANYARLLEIKEKYDPDALFYATHAVGSERWEMDADGRLCRISHNQRYIAHFGP